MAQIKTHKGDSKTELLELSPALFRIRRSLLEQFSRMERELKSRYKETNDKFVSREEFDGVIGRVNEFRTEMDSVLISMEERLHNVGERVIASLHRTVQDSPSAEKKPEDIYSGLNIFNLRRRYHEFSLKLRSEEVDPFGYDPIFDMYFRPLVNFLYEKYWRVETYGLSNIPKTGPCLLVGNHSGTLPYDAVMLKMAMTLEHSAHRDLRFMVEDFIFHFPFLGTFINRFGGVRASQENAEQILKQNMPAIVFPEGVKGLGKLYKDRYHLARFGRGGFIKLCLRTRAPLIPVAFIGAEEIHPMLFKETKLAQLLGVPYIPITPTFPFLGPAGMIPLPSKWSIHILPPIDFSNYGPGAEKDRVLVYKLARQVKEQIQDTIVEKLKTRRSIWFG